MEAFQGGKRLGPRPRATCPVLHGFGGRSRKGVEFPQGSVKIAGGNLRLDPQGHRGDIRAGTIAVDPLDGDKAFETGKGLVDPSGRGSHPVGIQCGRKGIAQGVLEFVVCGDAGFGMARQYVKSGQYLRIAGFEGSDGFKLAREWAAGIDGVPELTKNDDDRCSGAVLSAAIGHGDGEVFQRLTKGRHVRYERVDPSRSFCAGIVETFQVVPEVEKGAGTRGIAVARDTDGGNCLLDTVESRGEVRKLLPQTGKLLVPGASLARDRVFSRGKTLLETVHPGYRVGGAFQSGHLFPKTGRPAFHARQAHGVVANPEPQPHQCRENEDSHQSNQHADCLPQPPCGLPEPTDALGRTRPRPAPGILRSHRFFCPLHIGDGVAGG